MEEDRTEEFREFLTAGIEAMLAVTLNMIVQSNIGIGKIC